MQTPKNEDTPRTLPELFERSVERFAQNTMVLEKRGGGVYEGRTYAEMRLLVHRFAAGLMELGLKKGDRVALIAEGRPEWIVAELGILYAGGINVPISVKIEERAELAFRLHHAECTMAIASGNHLHKVIAILSELPDLRRIICLDPLQQDVPGGFWFGEILALGDERLRKDPPCVDKSWIALGGDDPANICYTSGTTADPKGIILTHRNYTANIEQGTALYPLPPTSCTLLILPWDHAFAHTCGIYALASTGGSIACVQVGKSLMETLRNVPVNINEVRPTFLMSVPALAKNFRKGIEKGVREKGKVAAALFAAGLKVACAYNGSGTPERGKGARMLLQPLVALLDAILFKKIRENFGGRLEYFIGGGALLDKELQRFFAAIGMPMYQGYGLTEAAPVISSNTPGAHILGSSGKLVPDLDLRICDEKGVDLPPGMPGEIVVRGENVMAGYWKNPRASAEVLRDGWLYTGDLGYLRQDEYLYVLGREKSLLISHDGEKYSPEGIEETIVEGSRYIDQLMLHNNQSPFTVALLVPNREAVQRWVEAEGLSVTGPEAPDACLRLLDRELARYQPGGSDEGKFPARWLPSACAVLDEPFTEQNRLLNSTMKMVRGRIEERYRDRIAELHGPEAKDAGVRKNLDALARLLAGS
jgi:long-chain acyl-CoA synthetase